MSETNKILVLDGNELLHKAIFVYRKNKKIPISFFFLKQVCKYVKMFSDVSKVIIASDSRDSWRKSYYPLYKAQRKEFRRKFTDIDWERVFKDYERLLTNINVLTNIHVISIDRVEGDDIISCICNYFKDNEVICVSQDKDLIQLLSLSNVKIYSPRLKDFRSVKNPIQELDKLIRKGDVSDNIPKVVTTKDYERNEKLINLLKLPEFIVNKVYNTLRMIDKLKKTTNYNHFMSIYRFKFLKEFSRQLSN